jgi:hypothetical protein
MFYAIDKITGKIVLSINMRYENYKSTYNKSLRFICGGCIDNGDNCNDNNVSFVNSKVRQPHFRHSKNTECSASKDFKEFNIDFYKKWFDLFKKEYRKPYWFNVKLEQISDDNYIIMIRHSHQSENTINKIEKYVKDDNKINWILSFENRKGRIKVFQGKLYIDFIGKNDIPIYNSKKSHIYLDNGYDVLLKVKLDSYNSKGQEIEIVYIKDFCKEYDELFDFDNLVYLQSEKESNAIQNYHEPCVIISSSGMITGGRVEKHIADNISNSYATILLIGYSAEGTLGRQLLSGSETIKVKDREYKVNARIRKIDVFSGHADQLGLLSFIKNQQIDKLKKVFLTHGEEESMLEFRHEIQKIGFKEVILPAKNETYLL